MVRRNSKKAIKKFVKHNFSLLFTIGAVIIGLFLGFILRQFTLPKEVITLINFPGEIFMQVLKLMILPLIFASLISALAQMNAKDSGQMGLITVLYYLTTTALATITGIILVLVIHPGDPTIKNDIKVTGATHGNINPLDTFLDLIRNMLPENIVQATFQRTQTVYIKPKAFHNITGSFVSPNRHRVIEYVPGMNIIGIIVFCTGFGIVISQLGERARIIIEFFIILEAVIMKFVEVIMWFAPLGIVCLICGNLLELDNLSDTATVLMMYVITVISALMFHTIINMPLLYFILTRKNPMIVVKGIAQAVVTGFGTASNGAALPLSMQCMENNLGCDRRITRFVLPMGSTINMDGNALYEAIAVIFIAQLNNVTLTLPEVITVSLTATLASLGLGSVPAGLVSILLILSTLGLPLKDIPLLITIDWLLDRIRTAINVLGDAFATMVVSHYFKEKLEKSDEDDKFHEELKIEIEQLKSAANSRNPSVILWGDNQSLKSYSSLPITAIRRHLSVDLSMSWRKSTLNPLSLRKYSKVSLSKVENV
ncbi:Excitatory amino acid transporter 2 [Strongyloides ratti]|uniref:Amino acid transporter n=1 Tax=Strongyloides ratti TaxID=34506 RepID=A0A090LUR2_STRRB|nr:Excitatory amino acid transporter 2 [Strongyloides ratti]CEF71369.1 Excitatory amino acid transporter 2 [Strongyloides ratti]